MDTARQISAYTLILVVVLKTFSMVSALVSFELNRQYYAEVLCVNKNRPELACHGKCVLMQKISMQIETEHHRSSDNYLNFFKKYSNLLMYSLKAHANHGPSMKAI